MDVVTQGDRFAGFRRLQARWVILAFIPTMIAGGEGADLVFTRMWRNGHHFWAESLATLLWYGLLFSFLLLYLKWRKLPVRLLFGQRPRINQFYEALRMVVPLVLLSIGLFYLLWYPLSYIQPDFVRSLMLGATPSVVWHGNQFAWPENIAQLLLIAVIIPTVEETVFRGFLLPRWIMKWNLPAGLVLSSALFAVLHADVLGAFVFSLIVSMVYLRTGSLFASIFLHSLNNALFWLLELSNGLVKAQPDLTLLDNFRSEAWMGALGLMVGIPWLIWFYRTRWLRPG
ncbi:MAG: hypothetical protein DSZ32_07465 [Gammaproteobacteria bacterium]|nr:MAG: hypothetical protein DSZ32_07465 [Gammaproteobacteria bacterium]